MSLFGAALHTYLRRLADPGPILLCIEDLHLADEATLELLRYLARRTRAVPVVLLGTFRADEVATGGPLAGFLAATQRESRATGLAIQQLMLDPLDRADTALLVESLLGDPTGEPLGASLYAASEGNPLFVEQLLLGLREEGQLAAARRRVAPHIRSAARDPERHRGPDRATASPGERTLP